ncbi:hypothetical protein GCM10010177_27490 [Actinomadura citrea]|nr:hypothetical protein GCM10010177_27490 [Actinomadura citrea]
MRAAVPALAGRGRDRRPGAPRRAAGSARERGSCWDFGVPGVTGRGLSGAVGDDTPGGKIGVPEMTCADVADVTQGARDQVANESGEPYG